MGLAVEMSCCRYTRVLLLGGDEMRLAVWLCVFWYMNVQRHSEA